MERVGSRPGNRKFKIGLFGEAQSGKSMLVDFLKNEHLTASDSSGANDQIFRQGLAPEEETDQYQATWGMTTHLIEQQITEQVTASMQVWEAGALFISKYPHYLEYLAKEADLIVYMVSVEPESEAMTRPINEFLTGLRGNLALARQAYHEGLDDRQSGDDPPNPKEVIIISGAAKYQSHA